MKIYSHVSANNIRLVEFPFNVELAMEGYIAENPDVLSLAEGDVVQVMDLEVPLKKPDKDGRIDILASYNNDTLAVVELKNGDLNKAHFEQLKGYFDGDAYLENAKDRASSTKPNWLGVLVGTGIESDFEREVLDNKYSIKDDIPLAVVVLRRYRDKESNQIFVIADVIAPKAGKDYSKYEFDGVVYKKNRLVLAFVKKCEMDGRSFDEVCGLVKGVKFIPSKPFMKSYEVAMKENETPSKGGHISWFYFPKDEDSVTFSGKKYAVLNWWTAKDMDPILKNAKAMGFNVRKV